MKVAMFSGGLNSFAAAKRVGADVLLFADTKIEDEDLYRFVSEAAASVSAELIRLEEGRDPWQVFHDVKFLGNTRVDPCSRVLKRELLRKWLEDNCKPEDTTVILGFDWQEQHRFERAKGYWEPWTVESPLCDPPYLTKRDHLAALAEEGIQPPRLYALGFQHNNCGGFCIKGGQAQFKHLLRTFPERYAHHEAKEEELRTYLGKDVAILRDRSDGKTAPLTMKVFRERIQQQPELLDPNDWGGCGCFDTVDETEEQIATAPWRELIYGRP